MRYLKYQTQQMKTLVITCILLLSGISTLFAQENETATVTIEIIITKYNKGAIFLAMYDSEESYMEDTYRTAKAKVVNNKATIIFEDVAKGVYAFSLFHDLNENKKLDTNFLGIPKEPYGFSKGEKGSFGPPKYEEVKFSITKNEIINVTIK
tara:strand:+ start:1131 stop:1586 length:456 start_codon:yes stop_codon:yes gene_type:complete